jgi:hypothetical protein
VHRSSYSDHVLVTHFLPVIPVTAFTSSGDAAHPTSVGAVARCTWYRKLNPGIFPLSSHCRLKTMNRKESNEHFAHIDVGDIIKKLISLRIENNGTV